MSPEMEFQAIVPPRPRVFATLFVPIFTGPVMAMVAVVGARVLVPAPPDVRFIPVKETLGVPLAILVPAATVRILLPQPRFPNDWLNAAPEVARLTVIELAKLELPLKL